MNLVDNWELYININQPRHQPASNFKQINSLFINIHGIKETDTNAYINIILY